MSDADALSGAAGERDVVAIPEAKRAAGISRIADRNATDTSLCATNVGTADSDGSATSSRRTRQRNVVATNENNLVGDRTRDTGSITAGRDARREVTATTSPRAQCEVQAVAVKGHRPTDVGTRERRARTRKLSRLGARKSRAGNG